jgi:CDP-diacylglycerol--inositol 3-phosphatidyltransferase
MKTTSVWLYAPNVIGYVRVLCLLISLLYASDPGSTIPFFALYSLSYLLDAVDGPVARYLGQTSQFGAVLDMVTDRVSTAVLLALLAQGCAGQGSHGGASLYLLLLVLDVGAHWVQMYAALLCGATSHKSLPNEPPLLTWYYRRHNLFAVCLLSEAHLVMALLLARGAVPTLPLLRAPLPWPVPTLPWGELPSHTLAAWLWALGAPVCALKQTISLLHLVRASQRVVEVDQAGVGGGNGIGGSKGEGGKAGMGASPSTAPGSKRGGGRGQRKREASQSRGGPRA